jgi:hypothetical protein
MVQQIQQNDIFGRIGQNFGQGLSEQIPKSIERKQLSEGLKKINPELGEAYGIPGVLERPEIAAQAAQYIRSNRQKEAIRGQNPQEGVPPQDIIPERQQKASPKFDSSADNYLVPDTAEEVDRRAADYSDKTGLPFEQAQAIEQRKADSRLQSEQAFEARANLGANKFEEYIKLTTQKDGKDIYGDYPGEMINEYDTLVKSDIANGVKPDVAAKARADELLNIAKARQNLSNESLVKWYQLGKRESGLKNIDNLRESYKKAGRLDIFKKDLTGKIGMQPSYASSVAFPVTENSKIFPAIKSYGKDSVKSFNTINESLGKNDSLQSIALAIENEAGKGAGQRFLDTIASERKAGRSDLTERQMRELETTFNPQASLTDVWYTSLGNLFRKHRGSR